MSLCWGQGTGVFASMYQALEAMGALHMAPLADELQTVLLHDIQIAELQGAGDLRGKRLGGGGRIQLQGFWSCTTHYGCNCLFSEAKALFWDGVLPLEFRTITSCPIAGVLSNRGACVDFLVLDLSTGELNQPPGRFQWTFSWSNWIDQAPSSSWAGPLHLRHCILNVLWGRCHPAQNMWSPSKNSKWNPSRNVLGPGRFVILSLLLYSTSLELNVDH